MKQLFLHIGQYKTGSTSIQKSLARNASRLAEHGVLYPTTGCTADQHTGLTTPLKREVRQPQFRFGAKTLMKEIAASGLETVIISNEGISGARLSDMEPEVVGHILSRIGEIFDGWAITVIYYYRRQDEAVESRIIQQIKGRSRSSTPSPEGYLRPREALDYSFFHETVAAALPQARVIPRCFSRSLLIGGDVVVDFCHVIGKPDLLRPQDISRVNVSPSGTLIGLQLAANILSDAGLEVERLIVRSRKFALEQNGPKAVVLDRDQRQQIMDYHAASNAEFVATVVPEAEREGVMRYFAAPPSEAVPNVAADAMLLARLIADSGVGLVPTRAAGDADQDGVQAGRGQAAAVKLGPGAAGAKRKMQDAGKKRAR